ncbi:GTP cyclohydrolase [Arachis hypogaea]|nr:GTP cyclohydrolase [Arachis hypogaea]
MIVDNPFNHHNINHFKHRYLIIQAVKLYAVTGLKPDDIIKFSRIRSINGEDVPFPKVAPWRRQDGWIDIDSLDLHRHHLEHFNSFVAGITALYHRATEGGIDAYRFMDLIRGESSPGEQQWGNTIQAWFKFIREHPATKYCRQTRRFREYRLKEVSTPEELEKAKHALECYSRKLRNGELENSQDFALRDPLSTNGEVDLNSKKVYAEPNIPFWAQCEYHLLPFHGVVHIGYFISDGFNPIGRSHLQSIIHFYGFKLQVQERLTRQVAEAISPLLGGDVIVVAEASHMCMISRGIEKFGSYTSTIAVLGRFATDVTVRASFLKTIPSHASCRAIILA